MDRFSLDSSIEEVMNEPLFEGFGRLIFPVDDSYFEGKTLEDFRLRWYTHMNPAMTVKVINRLFSDCRKNRKVFYSIYDESQVLEDTGKKDTGIFFLRGEKNAPFAVCVAGGNYEYVGALHDSFPHALAISQAGLNAFVLIYRPGEKESREDLARAISFIIEHADLLEVGKENYSLWGGSAGAKISAWLASHSTKDFREKEHPYPCCAVLQYTSLPTVYGNEPPTYINMGTRDEISNIKTMKQRMQGISENGTDTMVQIFEGLPHGYGVGYSTIAEGWTDNALAFWKRHMNE